MFNNVPNIDISQKEPEQTIAFQIFIALKTESYK